MAERSGVITATGRRKTAVARVRLLPGSGSIVVNQLALNDYFGRPTSRMIVQQPLELTATAASYDVAANVCGGGIAAQASAIRHGISRALVAANPDNRPTLKKVGFLTRDPRKVERKPENMPLGV